MKLHINPLSQAEFGAYRCVAKNSLGDTDGTIKLYSKSSWISVDIEKSETKPKILPQEFHPMPSTMWKALMRVIKVSKKMGMENL